MIWIALIALPIITLFATLNLALASRIRLAERFEESDSGQSFDGILRTRQHYVLATALARSTATLVLTMIVLHEVGAIDPRMSLWRLIDGFALVLVLIFVFAVAIPHAWAKYAGPGLIEKCVPLLAFVRIMLYPILVVLEIFDPIVRRLADAPPPGPETVANEVEQEILSAVSEGEMLGAVDEEEKEMIESVIELSDTRVEQIMTPRTAIAAIPDDADLNSILETIRTKGHTRVPVYRETIDSIVGILYAKDLLLRDASKPFNLSKIVRKALYVPESKFVRDLLREFREKKVHIAIVLDEYGGTAGLATIEDILEELVGDIDDEYDTEAPAELRRIDEHTIEVDASMRIDDLNDELKIALPENPDYETLGGFVFSTMGKIPKIGERYEHESVDIKVIGAEPQRITRLLLTLKAPSEEHTAEA